MATLEQARQIQALCDEGLHKYSYALGRCVENAVCHVLENKRSDQPVCVAPVVRRFKIACNDHGPWSSPADRGRALRRIAVAQLDSVGFDERAFEAVVGPCQSLSDAFNCVKDRPREWVEESIEAAIGELRRQGVPGVALMDQLEAERGSTIGWRPRDRLRSVGGLVGEEAVHPRAAT